MNNKNFDENKGTLFGLLSKLSYNNRLKITGLAVILPIIMILATICYSYSVMQTEYKLLNDLYVSTKKNESDLITYAILENNNKARMQTIHVKDKIVSDLNKEYSNTEDMKKDFLSKDINTKFYKILSDNISGRWLNKNNDNNRIFIATKEGVLIDDSINYVKNSFTDWETIINNTPDTITSKIAVDSIKQHKINKIILWIDNTSLDINSFKYDPNISYLNNKDSIEFIRNAVMDNKLQELSQYNVIVVSYIFDDRDIFGIPDTFAGQKYDNNKLYIIQIYSIQDMIDSNTYLKNTIENNKIILQDTKIKMDYIFHFRLLMTILFMIIEILAFFTVWYLAEFYIYSHNVNKKINNKLKI